MTVLLLIYGIKTKKKGVVVDVCPDYRRAKIRYGSLLGRVKFPGGGRRARDRSGPNWRNLINRESCKSGVFSEPSYRTQPVT